MKNKSLFSDLRSLLSTAFRFAIQHQQSRQAMEATYILQGAGDPPQAPLQVSTLEIQPYGSIFRVTQTQYLKSGVSRQSWLASYGWHCNGHLIAIGAHMYWIMDPAQGKLYVERYDERDDKIMDTYARL